MSQQESLSFQGSMDITVGESFSKVSLSSPHFIQEDSQAALPSLAQIVFGSNCQQTRQANEEVQVREKLSVEMNDVCLKDSRKRQGSNQLQKQAALLIDASLNDQQCFGFIIQESMSALPLRNLATAKSLIKAYANEYALSTDSQHQERKISLFACLLLAAIQLKGLNALELEGEAEQSIFSFSDKQMASYITNLTEQICEAIELNKQSKQISWQELESKIKDPQNKNLRRKFLSLTKFQPKYKAKPLQQSILFGVYIEYEESMKMETSNRDEIEKQTNNDNKIQLNYTDNNISMLANSSEGASEGQNMHNGYLNIEKQHIYVQYDTFYQDQTIQNGSGFENKFDNLEKLSTILLENSQKDVSIATEGFLTEIQISLEEIGHRKEDSDLFKSSHIIGFAEEESIINASSIF